MNITLENVCIYKYKRWISRALFFLNLRSTGNTLEELHRFFEDDPDDYLLESEAESRLKALYSCLVVRLVSSLAFPILISFRY